MAFDRKAAIALWERSLAHLEETDPGVIEWARGVTPDTFRYLKGKSFLSQYCFVVYASGFKYSTVAGCFDDLAEAFHYFDIAKLSRMRSVNRALKVFNNEKKARNFLVGAKLIAREGWPAFKKRLKAGGVDVLEELPGIGPITKAHLAKNIGLADVAKSDVWLVRAAEQCGARDVSELIEYLHTETGETRHVIDVAIWNLSKDGLLEPVAA